MHSPAFSKSFHHRAFTLVEVLTAFSIFGLVAMGIYGITSLVQRQTGSTMAKQKLTLQATTMFKGLQQDIAMAATMALSLDDSAPEKSIVLLQKRGDDLATVTYRWEKPLFWRKREFKGKSDRHMFANSLDQFQMEAQVKPSPSGDTTQNEVMISLKGTFTTAVPGFKDPVVHAENTIVTMRLSASADNDPNWRDIGNLKGVFSTYGDLLGSLESDAKLFVADVSTGIQEVTAEMKKLESDFKTNAVRAFKSLEKGLEKLQKAKSDLAEGLKNLDKSISDLPNNTIQKKWWAYVLRSQGDTMNLVRDKMEGFTAEGLKSAEEIKEKAAGKWKEISDSCWGFKVPGALKDMFDSKVEALVSQFDLENTEKNLKATLEEQKKNLEEGDLEKFGAGLEISLDAVKDGLITDIDNFKSQATSKLDVIGKELEGKVVGELRELDGFKEGLKVFEDAKGKYQTIKSEAEGKIKEVESTLNAIKDGAKDRAQAVLKGLEETKDKLVGEGKKKYDELKGRAEKFKGEAEGKLKELSGSLSEVKQKVTDLTKRVEDLKKQAKAGIDKAKGEIQKTQEAAEKKIKDAEKILADVKNKAEGMVEAKKAEVEKKVSELSGKLDSARAEASQKIQGLQKEVEKNKAAIESQIKTARDRFDSVKTQAQEKVDATRKTLDGVLARTDKEIQAAKDVFETAKKAAGGIENPAMKIAAETLNKLESAAAGEIKQAREKYDSVQASAKTEIEKADQTLSQTRSTLQEKISAEEKRLDSAVSSNPTIVSLEKDLANARAEGAKAVAAAETAAGQANAGAKGQVDAAMKQIEEAQKDLSSVREKSESVQKEWNQKLEEEMARLDGVQKDLQEKTSTLTQATKQFGDQLQGIESEFKTLVSQG